MTRSSFSWAFIGCLVNCFVACSANTNTRPVPTENTGGAAGEGGNPSTSGSSQGGFGGSGEAGFGGFNPGQGGAGGGVVMPSCKVIEDNGGNAPTCTDKAPANAFAPEVQWEWTTPVSPPADAISGTLSVPLVGNFTDDNSDGAIDLCDTPDVIVVAIETFTFGSGAQLALSSGGMYLLNGKDGKQILKFQGQVDSFVYPAFGDIDNDGLPEVLTANPAGQLVAYEHDGTLKWTSPVVGGYRSHFASTQCTTIGIYDLDANGTPEILFGFEVFDATGNRLFGDPTNASEFDMQYWCNSSVAADLDNDGSLEVIMGHVAFRASGQEYYRLNGFRPAHPQIGNLDADPEPEIFLTNPDGLTILEHTGALKFGPVRPTDPIPAPQCWGKPAVIHDFDGDGKADIAAATCSDYTAYEVGAASVTPKWTNAVQDVSGLATATAFDFLGDGVAEALYADENQIYAFDGKTGLTSLIAPRKSLTLIEYPVVADIDNDGSAEILYVSNYAPGETGVTLTALRDAQERWIPTRRIWNQYSYHVTNVYEDGRIPKVMKKNWQLLNTFRTNSQINATGVECNPEEPPK